MCGIPPQAAGRQLPDLAGQFDSGGPGTHDDDGQPVLLFGCVYDRLRYLEGPEDAPPQFECVIERLHARGEEGELVVPEVRLGHAGGNDEAVVGVFDFESPGHVGQYHLALEVKAAHLGQTHAHVLFLAHDVPQRGGDLARREHARGRLVEEGLEQVMIAPVDQSDVHRFPAQ